jgi:hypothetical protein
MGTFTSNIKVEWLDEKGADRGMMLTESVWYFDNNNKPWVACSGRSIDGASIPKFLWSIFGSPFVGDYRRASVFHDVACIDKSETHQAVHRMFYEAMLDDGVGKKKAWTMYQGVRVLGPKWEVEEESLI